MRTLSTRSMMSLAFERGEEFDPAIAPHADVVEGLAVWERATMPVEAIAPYERRRRRERVRRQALAAVPDWFSAQDLVERPVGVMGEVI